MGLFFLNCEQKLNDFQDKSMIQLSTLKKVANQYEKSKFFHRMRFLYNNMIGPIKVYLI